LCEKAGHYREGQILKDNGGRKKNKGEGNHDYTAGKGTGEGGGGGTAQVGGKERGKPRQCNKKAE